MEQEFADVVGTAIQDSSGPQSVYVTDECKEVSSSAPPSSKGVGTTVHRSWAASDGTFMPIGESHMTLPNGLYSCELSDRGPILTRMANNTDSLVDLPDSESERLLEEIVQFRTLKEKFNEHGFLYKRGILLWGPPGSGKTVTVQQLLKLFVTDGNGIALMVKGPGSAEACMHMIRKIEPDRQILAILEDLDALVDNYGESGYLNLLDGESQIENVVFVGTTNYPERLDKRFVDRPSRFDTIRYIGMPSDAARKAYINHKVPSLADDVVDQFVDGTDGFSIAYMRELIVLTQCFGISLDSALTRLRKMQANQPKSNEGNDKVAFGFA